ncbi:hypothetical protein WJX72_003570 [[Myrmecia] bisecta]|uniref:BRO1 domain-containing protein n=1 Tax=[Myrmecia] bisecta TaxID=41462 RepID=A0AAW1Q390_9CHLO
MVSSLTAGRQSTDVKVQPRICLLFEDHWDQCITKTFKFDSLKLKESSEALTLEHMRELTSLRARSVGKAGAQEGLGFKDWTTTYFEQYITFLANLMEKAEAVLEQGDNCTFEYTSPLAGQPKTFYKLKGLQVELAMALLLYASALRQQAYTVVTSLEVTSLESSEPNNLKEDHTDHLAAATLLRKAAGIYDHVKDTILVGIRDDLPPDRPAEVLPSMVEVLSKATLAEAQAVTANRAEMKGTSPSLVTALHRGTSDMFEEAAGVLKQHTGDFNTISQNLRKFLALSSTLHELRAWKAWAAYERSQQSPGVSVANLQAASQCIRECLPVVEEHAKWRQVFQAEARQVDEQLEICDRERQVVYFQSVAKQPSKLPLAKVIVNAIKYEPKQLFHSFI